MTPDEARDALEQLLLEAPRDARVVNASDRVTLREAADEWLRYEEHEAKVKRSTAMDYRNCADRLCRELGDVALEDITPQMIERWKAGFRAERRLADGSLRRTLEPCLGDVGSLGACSSDGGWTFRPRCVPARRGSGSPTS